MDWLITSVSKVKLELLRTMAVIRFMWILNLRCNTRKGMESKQKFVKSIKPFRFYAEFLEILLRLIII